MSQFIKHLNAIGIHGRFDIDLSFQDGINIVHGSNGTGKTTILHILTNGVNGDFRRFGYLKFKELTITLDNDTKIRLNQDWTENPDNTKTTVVINNNYVDSYEFRELKIHNRTQTLDRIDLELIYSLREKLELKELISPTRKKIKDNQNKKYFDLKATYFPAFRTMIEAWATLDESEIRYVAHKSPNLKKLLKSSEKSTELARILFGNFVPHLQYPSPLEIEQHINSELIEAQLNIATSDRNLLSDAFVQSFQAISKSSDISDIDEQPEDIIKKIEEISERLQNLPFEINDNERDNVYERLREQLPSFELDLDSKNLAKKVLSVYKKSLQKRLDEQTKAYANIEKYLKSVNEFLERKKLEIHTNFTKKYPKLGVKIGKEKSIHSLQTLSSGERQIVGLIYAASHMIDGRVVLIDEPEISLHIDWQRKLLPEMTTQLGDKQLIICTHSPIIASQYQDRMIEIELKPTSDQIIVEYKNKLEIYDELDEIPF